eukprot:TRINITY_DN35783_c0_g1_i2.p1 TRINITY_DN35783_c0_g1~~TRINITY_DN35783_c0_g1_i2.p1  ORF type:complete len:268 (+),score=28.46 TRINITY_DN35783_c0_g1_i2:79-882(+)
MAAELRRLCILFALLAIPHICHGSRIGEAARRADEVDVNRVRYQPGTSVRYKSKSNGGWYPADVMHWFVGGVAVRLTGGTSVKKVPEAEVESRLLLANPTDKLLVLESKYDLDPSYGQFADEFHYSLLSSLQKLGSYVAYKSEAEGRWQWYAAVVEDKQAEYTEVRLLRSNGEMTDPITVPEAETAKTLHVRALRFFETYTSNEEIQPGQPCCYQSRTSGKWHAATVDKRFRNGVLVKVTGLKRHVEEDAIHWQLKLGVSSEKDCVE